MNKILIFFIFLLMASHLPAQINAALNINYWHELKSKSIHGLSYRAVAGYSFKQKKMDINLKVERLNWTMFKLLLSRQTSSQLELKYHITGVKRSINPYIGIGTGYFFKTEGFLNTKYTETKIGFLAAVGVLFKLQAVKNQLYLDTRFSYYNVKYKTNPFSSWNLSAGLLFYFKDTPVIMKKAE